MPLFDYECKCGKQFEKVLPVAEYDKDQKCPECGKKARKIIVLGSGGIWRKGDSLPWVRDAAKVLTDGDRPNPNINSVDDLRNYYQTHPEVIPAESHPAFPSAMGDIIKSKPNPKEERKIRSRKAHDKLREMRSINISSRP